MLPAKKVIVDLALRTSWDEESLSPYEGFYTLLVNKYKSRGGIHEEFWHLLAAEEDFDSIRKGVRLGSYSPEYKDKARFGDHDYILDLERVDVSWVEHYFENVLVNLNGGRTSSSCMSYAWKHNRVRAAEYDSESGEFNDPYDRVVESYPYTFAESLDWIEIIPYYLKRFHTLSIRCGIHIMSMIISIERYKRDKNVDEPKPTALIESYPFYKMNKDGTIGPVVLNNKHEAHNALQWAKGQISPDATNGLDVSTYNDLANFLRICKRVEIDLTREDALSYNKEYIESLVVTYIVTNKDLAARVNPTVLDGLKGLTLDAFNKPKAVDKNNDKTYSDIALNKRMLFYTTRESAVRSVRDFVNQTEYLKGYTQALAKTLDDRVEKVFVTDDTRSDHGFYTDNAGNYLIFRVNAILDLDKSNAKHAYAILHCSGTFVLLDVADNLTYLPLHYATAYLQYYFKTEGKPYKDPDMRFGESRGYGRWITTEL